eukprot:gene5294-22844_t
MSGVARLRQDLEGRKKDLRNTRAECEGKLAHKAAEVARLQAALDAALAQKTLAEQAPIG